MGGKAETILAIGVLLVVMMFIGGSGLLHTNTELEKVAAEALRQDIRQARTPYTLLYLVVGGVLGIVGVKVWKAEQRKDIQLQAQIQLMVAEQQQERWSLPVIEVPDYELILEDECSSKIQIQIQKKRCLTAWVRWLNIITTSHATHELGCLGNREYIQGYATGLLPSMPNWITVT